MLCCFAHFVRKIRNKEVLYSGSTLLVEYVLLTIRCDTHASTRQGYNGAWVSITLFLGCWVFFLACFGFCFQALSLSLLGCTGFSPLMEPRCSSIEYCVQSKWLCLSMSFVSTVVGMSFDFALFNHTLNCADGSSFFGDLFYLFMVNDKLHSLFTHSEDICQLRPPICVPFIVLAQGSPKWCAQATIPWAASLQFNVILLFLCWIEYICFDRKK